MNAGMEGRDAMRWHKRKEFSHAQTNQQNATWCFFVLNLHSYTTHMRLLPYKPFSCCCNKTLEVQICTALAFASPTTPATAEADEPRQALSLAPSCSPSSRRRGVCGDGG